MALHTDAAREELDRAPDRVPQCLVEIFIEPDRDPVRVGFAERRPHQANRAAGGVVGQHGEPNIGAQRTLERGQAHFAVALREVRVPGVEVGAFDLHRQVQRRTGDERGDVEVAAVRAGRGRRQLLRRVGRDTHDPEERGERKPRGAARAERDHALRAVDSGEDPHRLVAVLRILARQRAELVAVRDHAVGNAAMDREHLDLEQVARSSAVDRNWPCDDVRAHARAVRDRVGDVDRVVEHVVALHAVTAEPGDGITVELLEDAFVRNGVDRDDVARRDAQHRLRRACRQGAPPHGVRS